MRRRLDELGWTKVAASVDAAVFSLYKIQDCTIVMVIGFFVYISASSIHHRASESQGKIHIILLTAPATRKWIRET